MDRLQQVMDAIDDPCDDGGFDIFCRNARGESCPEVAGCVAPDYPCIARLRTRLATAILAENDARRR